MALALYFEEKLSEALGYLVKGLAKEGAYSPSRRSFTSFRECLEDQLHVLATHPLQNDLPYDSIVRKKFEKFLDWLQYQGAEFSKLKLRFYSENYRGVHSTEEI